QNVLGKIADHVEELHTRDEIGEIAGDAGIPQRSARLPAGGGDLVGPFPLAYEAAVDRVRLGVVEEGRELVQLGTWQRRPPGRRRERKQPGPRWRARA